MTKDIAEKIMRRDTRAKALADLAKGCEESEFDKELESAYTMAADALKENYMALPGYEYDGKQLYVRL